MLQKFSKNNLGFTFKIMTDTVSHIEQKNIFTVDRSQLENRFDAQFYKYSYDYTGFIRLSKIAFVKGGKRIPLGLSYDTQETPFLYLRVVDINMDDGISFNSLNYISENVFNILSRYEIYENDLAISIAGTIGKIILLKKIPQGKRIILTENCAKILLKEDAAVLPEYLQLILQTTIIQRQIELNYIQTTIPKLGLDRISNLWLPPMPPFDSQRKIVQKFHLAFNKKQQKESEAKTLLSSIDTYILSELGITFIERENSLKSRVFTVNFSEVTSERLDAFYYANDFLHIEKELKEKKTNVVFFKDIINSITNGFDFRDYKENGTPYIKVANVRKGKFDFSKIQYIDISSEELVKKIQLKKGNLLLTRKGTFGNALALTKDYNYIISSEIFYIELKLNKINPSYLEALFNSSFGQKQFEKISIGAIMGSLSQEALKKLIIPLPSMEKQNKIAANINNIYRQIEKLQNDAIEILETAKQEVEEMILG
jgi:type I restriction enzyme, S subunit